MEMKNYCCFDSTCKIGDLKGKYISSTKFSNLEYNPSLPKAMKLRDLFKPKTHVFQELFH
jgi:hypothetical protein